MGGWEINLIKNHGFLHHVTPSYLWALLLGLRLVELCLAWPLFFVRVMLAGLRPTIIYILTPNFSSERMGVGVELWTDDFARCTLFLAWSKYQAYI